MQYNMQRIYINLTIDAQVEGSNLTMTLCHVRGHHQFRTVAPSATAALIHGLCTDATRWRRSACRTAPKLGVCIRPPMAVDNLLLIYRI
jgi:hypothetical protein